MRRTPTTGKLGIGDAEVSEANNAFLEGIMRSLHRRVAVLRMVEVVVPREMWRRC